MVTCNYNINAIIGAVLKIERKKKALSLKQINELVDVSAQYLSDIENGKKQVFIPTMDKIFESMDIHFNFDEEILKQADFKFNELIEAYLQMNREKRTKLIQEIVNHSQWEYSLAYPLVQLTKYMATVLEEVIYDYDVINEKCMMLFSLFTNRQKSLYLLMRAIHEYYDCKEYDNALNDLVESTDISPNDPISGYSYNQLGILYEKDYQLHKAFECQKKSNEILLKNHYYKRNIYAEMEIAKLYQRFGMIEEMKHQYLKIIELESHLNVKGNIGITKYNYAYDLMISEEYDEAIQRVQEVLSADMYKHECYYILAWSYLELKETEKARKAYEQMKRYNKHDDYILDAYEKCIRYRLESKSDQYYRKLKSLYKRMNKYTSALDKLMVLEKIVKYAEEHQFIEDLCIYQKEMLKILYK